MKKDLAKQIDLKRSQKSVLKNKKTKIGKIIKGALIGMSLFSAGASIASDKAATIKQQEYNIALIDRINVGNKINTEYDSLLKTELSINNSRKFISNSKYLVKDQSEIFINFKIPELTDVHKTSIECAVELLNEINVKTYTGFPTLKINYSPTAKDFANPTSVTVEAKDVLIKKNAAGIELGIPIITTNGIQTIYDHISLKKNILSNPIHTACVLTHELMHSLYGIGDQYLIERKNNAITYYDTIMNIGYSFLSLNDVKMIDYLSWKGTLSEQQIQNVKNYYEEYQQRYENSNKNHMKVEVTKRLFENKTITEEKIIEQLGKKYYSSIDKNEKIKNITEENFYYQQLYSPVEIDNNDFGIVEQNVFNHITPEKMESYDFSIQRRNDEYVFEKQSKEFNSLKYKNFTIFGDKFYFEYQNDIYFIDISDDDLFFNVNSYKEKSADTYEYIYKDELESKNALYENCKDLKTKSFRDMVEKMIYNKVLVDYNNNLFKISYNININDYKIDESFGNKPESYKFSVNYEGDFKLVSENKNGTMKSYVFDNTKNKVIQEFKNLNGVMIGTDMVFLKIGKKTIGIMLDEDKLIKDKDGYYDNRFNISTLTTDYTEKTL